MEIVLAHKGIFGVFGRDDCYINKVTVKSDLMSIYTFPVYGEFKRGWIQKR